MTRRRFRNAILVGSRIPTFGDQRAYVLWVPPNQGFHLDSQYQTDADLSGGHTGWNWTEQEASDWINGNDYWTRIWAPFDTDLLLDEGL